MTVFIAVICICAWLVGAAVKYRLEELKKEAAGKNAHQDWSGKFRGGHSLAFRFWVALATCLFVSDIILVYVGSWDTFGIWAIKIPFYIVLHAAFTHFVGLLPGSLAGACLYTYHHGEKSGLYRKAAWWILATYLLSVPLADMGYGVISSAGSLRDYQGVRIISGAETAKAIGFFGAAIIGIVIPLFLVAFVASVLVESIFFFGAVYVLSPKKDAVAVATPAKVNRHKKRRRF